MYVVIVDSESLVRGLGTIAEGSVAAVPGAGRQIAYVADFDPSAHDAAYGVLGDERIACRWRPENGGSPGGGRRILAQRRDGLLVDPLPAFLAAQRGLPGAPPTASPATAQARP